TEQAVKDHQRVDTVRQVMDKYRDDAQLFLGGVSMITSDMITYIKNDLVVFGIAILLFIVVMLAFIFRQLRYIVLPLVTCLMSVLLMLGWISWIDWRVDRTSTRLNSSH